VSDIGITDRSEAILSQCRYNRTASLTGLPKMRKDPAGHWRAIDSRAGRRAWVYTHIHITTGRLLSFAPQVVVDCTTSWVVWRTSPWVQTPWVVPSRACLSY